MDGESVSSQSWRPHRQNDQYSGRHTDDVEGVQPGSDQAATSRKDAFDEARLSVLVPATLGVPRTPTINYDGWGLDTTPVEHTSPSGALDYEAQKSGKHN